MDRHETDDVLSAMLDGELTQSEAAAAAEHLAVCERCRGAFAGLRSARQFVKRASRRTMPAGLAAELQRRVDAPPAPAFRRFVLPWARLAVPALSFATASFMGGLWVWERNMNVPPEIPIEQLMAAHERYLDEGLLVAAGPAQADFTATLASEPQDDNDTDSEDL